MDVAGVIHIEKATTGRGDGAVAITDDIGLDVGGNVGVWREFEPSLEPR